MQEAMSTKISKPHAERLWPLIVDLATNEETVTYKDLASLANEKYSDDPKLTRYNIAHPLGVIQKYCIKNKMPMLTALVIRKDYGFPGDGFAWEHIGYNDSMENDGSRLADLWQSEVQKVYPFDWGSVNPNFDD